MTCNKRFKGVENFLRRIAFNLGNTPSQTEVKIISCIPIDVTDLQQKIAELEKKLEESSNQPQQPQRQSSTSPVSPPGGSLPPVAKTNSKRTSIVNTAITGPFPHKRAEYQDSSVSTTYEYHPNQKSVLHVYDPKYCRSHDCTEMPINKQDNYKQHSQHQHLLQQRQRKCLFSKNKRSTKKKSCNKTELIYYAKQEDRTPFNNYGFKYNPSPKNVSRHDEEELEEARFLSSVLRKQYVAQPALNNLSNISEFSTPICRDDPPLTTLYESDVCSCCRGPFKNLDEHMKPFNKLHTFPTTENENIHKYSYYDSNAYDVIPVKENITKPETEHASPKPKKKHIQKYDATIKCCPEKTRVKRIQPIIVNYHTVAPTRNYPYKKYHKRDVVLRAMSAKRPMIRGSDRNSDDSKICYVDYSDVYARRKKPRRQKMYAIPKLNDASCLVTLTNNTDCQTTTESNENPVEDRTATTLNQIKTILQSVLAEVKTNSKLGKPHESKKDAIVQNISQTNMCGGSHLLQSFTYSPYNMNPYVASCSRQIPTTSCPTNPPFGQTKCMHYPLFVQPNRHMCSSCYKNGNGRPIGMMNTNKFAASTATNTEEQNRHSKETQKLIKQIYDSIAVNIEVPAKGTTKNQGDQGINITALKTTPIKKENDLISELYKNLNPINTSVTEKTDSKATSKTNSVRSEYDTNRTVKNVEVEPSEGNTTTSEQDTRKGLQVYEEESDDDDEDDDEEDESTVVAEGDDAIESSTHTEYEPEHEDNSPESEPYESDKKEKQIKKGLFSKMMKIFQPRNRKKTKTIKESEESESDSDDYQTIYSQRTTLKAHPTRLRARSKAKQTSRGRHRQSPEKGLRRPPYMEQEYRRYWDEKLIFQNRIEKRSTEESGPTTQLTRPYNRNYETRIAMPVNNEGITISKQASYPVKRSTFPTNRASKLKTSAPKLGGLAWLKKHKPQCGEQWKRLILES